MHDNLIVILFHMILIIFSFLGAKQPNLKRTIVIFMGIGPIVIVSFIYLVIWLEKIDFIVNAGNAIEQITFLALYVPVFAIYFGFRRKQAGK